MTKRIIIIATIAVLCGACRCAAQTETTGIDDQPRVTNQTNTPTSQAVTAGGDATVEGSKTKTVTVVGVPWYGLAVLAGLGVAGLVAVLFAMHRWGYHRGNWKRKANFNQG